MRKGEGIALRIDGEMQSQIEALGRRLGTTNISAIIRIGFMSGCREINQLPAQLVEQSYKEGVFEGVAVVKAKLEHAFSEALKEGSPIDG